MLHLALAILLLPGPAVQSPPAEVTPLEAPTSGDLVPGELPADATPEAVLRWRALCAAVGVAEDGQPLTGFELEFEGRAFLGGQSNDFDIKRFLYLEPGWVRMELKSGRVRLRGPDGDFLLDTKRGTSVRLRGKELANDIRELNETVRIAKSFVGLSDPSNLRIAQLRLGSTPTNLPEALREEAAALEWLDLTSPDFHKAPPRRPADEAPVKEPLYRVRIGCTPGTHLPKLAVIHDVTDGMARIESALLLDFQRFKQIDGFQVPIHLRTHVPDVSASPWVFAERRRMELWMLAGDLSPELGDENFLPKP